MHDKSLFGKCHCHWNGTIKYSMLLRRVIIYLHLFYFRSRVTQLRTKCSSVSQSFAEVQLYIYISDKNYDLSNISSQSCIHRSWYLYFIMSVTVDELQMHRSYQATWNIEMFNYLLFNDGDKKNYTILIIKHQFIDEKV